MRCPFCGYSESKVTDSRASENGGSIRRRRECLACGKRFTTHETIEHIPLVVIKKDGSRQMFDKSKLIDKLLRACEKRPIELSVIEDIATEVEQSLQNSLKREVPTKEIGELILARLREIDQVAYVRFASVYRDFNNVESFMAELKTLKGKNK